MPDVATNRQRCKTLPQVGAEVGNLREKKTPIFYIIIKSSNPLFICERDENVEESIRVFINLPKGLNTRTRFQQSRNYKNTYSLSAECIHHEAFLAGRNN